jgi:acyl-CoA reductase-like NAD-dependent aldehyde dehydrogenase
VKEEVLRLVIKKTSALRPGDPLDAETTYGAMASQAHQKKVMDYIADGEREGATVAFASAAAAPIETGFYVAPVIFDDVDPEQKIAQEEIFGPVLSVMSFKDEADAIRKANATIYGLSAILWTTDLGRAHRVSQQIDAGWTVVMATAAPREGLGAGVLSVGGHKQSGLGTEGGLEGLAEYTFKTAVQLFV